MRACVSGCAWACVCVCVRARVQSDGEIGRCSDVLASIQRPIHLAARAILRLNRRIPSLRLLLPLVLIISARHDGYLLHCHTCMRASYYGHPHPLAPISASIPMIVSTPSAIMSTPGAVVSTDSSYIDHQDLLWKLTTTNLLEVSLRMQARPLTPDH
jgi:hypothetical protein